MKTTFTHRGWFLACPVLIDKPDAIEPTLAARPGWDWWMTANEILYGVFAIFAAFIAPRWEPTFPILITGPLEHPVVLDGPTTERS